MSFPFESGQEPYYYNHKATGRPYHAGGLKEFTARYRETDNAALYSFGSGMGFAPFTYDETQLSGESLPWNGEVTVSSRITNTGKVAGEEVVQLYIRDRVASITRPVRELKGFRKIQLAPGASADVAFTLTRKDLEFVGADLKWIAEPGAFDVWIAPSASTGTPKSFRLLDRKE